MRISELASRSGVPATTLRYYESVGLLDSLRTPNGYRSYGEDALARLALIEAGKHLDLSLPEIGELLDTVESDTCTGVREALRPILNQRLDDVDRRLSSLHLLRDRLAAATEQVAACPDSGRSCRSECMVLGAPFNVCAAPRPAWATPRTDPRGRGRGPLDGTVNSQTSSDASSGGRHA